MRNFDFTEMAKISLPPAYQIPAANGLSKNFLKNFEPFLRRGKR
jgi:hypothetical protein